MKKILALSFLIAVAVLNTAQAMSSVNVFGEGAILNVIDGFYDALEGVESSVTTGTLNGADLAGVDLLWAIRPGDDYRADEIDAMELFLGNGGRIVFMSDHGGLTPEENIRISNTIAALGGSIAINNVMVDAGFRKATRTNGQIVDHTLTAGVDAFDYAAFAPLVLGGNAQALLRGSDLTSVLMAFENIGPGTIFAVADQNIWARVNDTAINDNAVMFENLLSAATGAPPVMPLTSAPSTLAILGLGLAGISLIRRVSPCTA